MGAEGGKKYDIVWAQWCLEYLDDREPIQFPGWFSGQLFEAYLR